MSNQLLVKKVQLKETLLGLPIGQHSFRCTLIGSMSAVRMMACRLNKSDEEASYSVSSPDNGATIVITKTAKNHE